MYKGACVPSAGSSCLLEWVVRALWLCLGGHGICLRAIWLCPDPFSRICCFLSSCRMGSCILPIVLQCEMPLPSPTPALEKVQMWALSYRLVVPQHRHTTRQTSNPSAPTCQPHLYSKQSTWPLTLIRTLPPGKNLNACKTRAARNAPTPEPATLAPPGHPGSQAAPLFLSPGAGGAAAAERAPAAAREVWTGSLAASAPGARRARAQHSAPQGHLLLPAAPAAPPWPPRAGAGRVEGRRVSGAAPRPGMRGMGSAGSTAARPGTGRQRGAQGHSSLAGVSLSRAPPVYDLALELFPGAAKADSAEDKVAFGTSQSYGPSQG